MTLLIVGATGTLGRQITRNALDRGLKVRCLVRNPQKAAFLKEWGADLAIGSLNKPDTLAKALEGAEMVIDAATTKAIDPARIKKTDWDGKVALIQAAEKAEIKRFIFFSILNAEKYPNVPLMDIKNCTEKFLAKTDLDYTILRPCGFFQNLISEYAIPMLENQTIWVGAEDAPIAYMSTQDIAKFAIATLSSPEASRQTLPIAGLKAWAPSEIIRQCERFSGRVGRTARMPLGAVRFARNLALCFEGGWSFAERVAYVEVQASGVPIDADMTRTYEILGVDREQIATLESYLQEYFGRILRKLKELDYKEPKVKSTF